MVALQINEVEKILRLEIGELRMKILYGRFVVMTCHLVIFAICDNLRFCYKKIMQRQVNSPEMRVLNY